MKKRKVKRYDEGGKTEEDYKKEGLASSKGEKVGFLERLRMGNIDDPKSEAYYKFGAGRAKMAEESKTPVPEMSSDYSGKSTKTPEADVSSEMMPKRKPVDIGFTGDDEEERTISKYIRSSPKEETVEEKEEVKVKPKAKPKPKAKSATEVARTMGEGYMKAAQAATPMKKEPMYDLAKAGRALADTFSSERATKRYAESTPYARAKMGMKSGGKVSSASSRADGVAQRGKTRGRIC